LRASAAQERSRTATGSSSPAIATSIAAFSNRALVPNSASTVGTDTFASPAIARMVAAPYPRSRNTAVAASSTRWRVRRAWASRKLDRYRRGWRDSIVTTADSIRYGDPVVNINWPRWGAAVRRTSRPSAASPPSRGSEPDLADGVEFRSRGTRAFERRNAQWQMVHQHLSIPATAK